jgi:hypothetical protein
VVAFADLCVQVNVSAEVQNAPAPSTAAYPVSPETIDLKPLSGNAAAVVHSSDEAAWQMLPSANAHTMLVTARMLKYRLVNTTQCVKRGGNP